LRQELERWARKRYDDLDHLDADLHWYRGQYGALDALVEALSSPDWWLVYRAEALLDLPPEQSAQAAGGASIVERVRTALVERDDALRGAREDLAGAHSVAVTPDFPKKNQMHLICAPGSTLHTYDRRHE
jgi:hypothetical protein